MRSQQNGFMLEKFMEFSNFYLDNGCMQMRQKTKAKLEGVCPHCGKNVVFLVSKKEAKAMMKGFKGVNRYQ